MLVTSRHGIATPIHVPANTHPANTHPANTHPANTHPANTHPANTHPANTHPTSTHPAAGAVDVGVSVPKVQRKLDLGVATVTFSGSVTASTTIGNGEASGGIEFSRGGISVNNGKAGVEANAKEGSASSTIGGVSYSVSGSGFSITVPTGKRTAETVSIQPNPHNGIYAAGAALAGGVVAVAKGAAELIKGAGEAIGPVVESLLA